jgi:hypothetical protein
MPIEIKELVIRANVQEQAPEQAQGGALDENAKAALLEECVEQVMELLKQQNER